MNLVKTSFLNGIAVSIKILTMVILNKILAIHIGPNGYAVISQFQNAMAMITTIASGGINTGVTKYTAEYNKEVNNLLLTKLWQTSFAIAFIGSVTLAIPIFIFSVELSQYFFDSPDQATILRLFSISLLFFVLNTYLLAILNGKKEILKYVKVNIISSLFSLVFTGLLAFNYGLFGALIALATNQSIIFFVTLMFCYKSKWFELKSFYGKIDRAVLKNLSKYTLMALVSAITLPVSHMLVRDHIVQNMGWNEAGLWDAMWKISTIYLMFVTTTLSVYYLPRLSEISDKLELRKEILSGYKLILPLTILCSLSVYLLRDFIVLTLFTPEFEKMRILFGWQMFGDTVKISSWMLGFLFAAKGMVKLHVASQIIFTFLFYGLVVVLSERYGLISTAIAHSINYFCHFCFVFVSLKVCKVI